MLNFSPKVRLGMTINVTLIKKNMYKFSIFGIAVTDFKNLDL